MRSLWRDRARRRLNFTSANVERRAGRTLVVVGVAAAVVVVAAVVTVVAVVAMVAMVAVVVVVAVVAVVAAPAVMAVAAMMAMMASGVAAVGGGGGMMAMIAGHQKDEGKLDGKPAQRMNKELRLPGMVLSLFNKAATWLTGLIESAGVEDGSSSSDGSSCTRGNINNWASSSSGDSDTPPSCYPFFSSTSTAEIENDPGMIFNILRDLNVRITLVSPTEMTSMIGEGVAAAQGNSDLVGTTDDNDGVEVEVIVKKSTVTVGPPPPRRRK